VVEKKIQIEVMVLELELELEFYFTPYLAIIATRRYY
jgi:hypothetical protein